MESLNDLFAWISANPAWGGIGVFLIAFAESLALVGLLLPGAAMMFGIGAMVATDILPLGPTLIWAALGAICGDGVSFWLGRHYHMRLKTMWPLSRHPELITRATGFFHHHGGKSILFGRFVGPIRPVIPAVAGMLEMSFRRFALFNLISGVLWAPVYVLPGMIFTTSLGLAAEVASRLAVMAGSMLALLIAALWFSRLAFNWYHHHTYPFIQRILWWSRLHPLAGQIPASLLDPAHPEARGLTMLALLLLVATILFGIIIGTLGEGEGLLAGLNHNLYFTLLHLRTPAIDQLFLLFDQLGEYALTLSLSILVLLWLLYRGLRRAATHWLAAVGFGVLLGVALSLVGREMETAALIQQASANTELLVAITCFGFLGVLLGREVPLQQRWLVYTLSGLLILALSFARFYLGVQELGSILGVLTLGVAWVALLGIGYRNHPAERLPPIPLSLLSGLLMIAFIAWQTPLRIERDLQRDSQAASPIQLTTQQWRLGTVPGLPAFRDDLRGRHSHPLNLQFAGPLDVLQAQLKQAGWKTPPQLDALSWLVWLNPQTPLSQMPVLPQVHDGYYQEMLLTKELNGSLLALRLWRSPYLVGEAKKPLWLGNVSMLSALSRGGLTVPRTRENFDEALKVFHRELEALPAVELHSQAGRLLLTLKEAPPSDN